MDGDDPEAKDSSDAAEGEGDAAEASALDRDGYDDPTEDDRDDLTLRDALEAEGSEPGEGRELTPAEQAKLDEAMRRMRAALGPRLPGFLAEFNRNKSALNLLGSANRIPKGFLPKVSGHILGNYAALNLTKNLLPKPLVSPAWLKQVGQVRAINSDIYKMAGLGQPKLNLLGSELVKNFDFGVTPRSSKLLAQFAKEQTSWLNKITRITAGLKFRFYPDNLHPIEGLRIEEVEAVVMLDGIALYTVPRTEIAEAIIRADSTAARRDILGRRWRAISTDCRTALDACDSTATKKYKPFALAALDALDANNPKAAQALAANILDTVINNYFGKHRYKLTPSKSTKNNDEYQNFTIREFIAFAPLWQAYQTYRAEDGDPIPATFSRHATVHGVTGKQFSRRNAVQAILFVTGLLAFMDEEASKQKAA